MKQIKQFVYYSLNDDRNTPQGSEFNNPWIYNLFSQYRQISHLGIQGEPGVRFCINGSEDKDAIMIGSTGIYEIDLDGVGYISSLRFLEYDLNYFYKESLEERRLIVDFIYEGVV